MLKEQARFLATSVFLVDLGLVVVAFFLAFWVRADLLPAFFPDQFSAFYPLTTYLPLLPLVIVIWGALLQASDRYRSHRTVVLLDEAFEIVKVCASGLAILALTFYAFRLDERLLAGDEFSRLWVLLVGSFACVLILMEKLAVRIMSRYVRSRGYNYRTVLIVGTNPSAITLADSIRNHRFWGFKVAGFVAHPPSEALTAPKECLPLVGTIDEIPRLVEENVIDDVLFCVSRRDLDQMEDLFLGLQEQGIRTRFAVSLFPHTKASVKMEDVDGMPLLTFSTAPQNWLQLTLKRVLDVGLSLLLVVLGMPVMLGIAMVLKITQGGEVLYSQTRCGLNGRRFKIYKFRTMVEGAEEKKLELMHLNEMDGPVFKLRQDPRVTTFGRFLRRFSLDELPQFWNVLRGEMSLVGPRPPIPDEVAKYQRWQRRRLSMKPGLTCLWQISGRNQIDFERWIRLDLEYIDSWTPWLDMQILLKTVPAVLSGRGAS